MAQSIRTVPGPKRLVTYITQDVGALEKLLAASLAVHLYVISWSVVPSVGPLGVLETVSGIIYVTFLPGALVLALLGRDLDKWEALPMVVGASLVVMMFGGTTLNIIFRNTTLLPGQPLDPIPLKIGLFGITLFLTLCVYSRRPQPALPPFSEVLRDTSEHPFVLLSLGLPVLAATGATLLNHTGDNTITLLSLTIFSLVPLAMLGTRIPPRHRPFVLWMTALALLLGNTILITNLQTGDAVREFYNANLVLNSGNWDPGFTTTKNGMLRIVILHPIYERLTTLSLFWEFKLVHPFLFSFITISLWAVFRNLIRNRVAAFAVFMFMSFHTFFVIYSRNTRSGIALFFVSLVLLLAIQDGFPDRRSAPLFILFCIGIIVSHYGIAIIFGFVLLGAYVISVVLRLWRREPAFQATEIAFLGLYFCLFITWYQRTSSGRVFKIFTSAFIVVLISIGSFLSGDSVAGNAISTTPESITHTFIKYEFIAIVVLVGIGISLVGLVVTQLSSFLPLPDRVWPDEANLWQFALGVAAVGVLSLAFAPISFFGLGRFWMISMVFLLPFAFLPLTNLLVEIFGHTRVQPAIAMLLTIMLLMNTGAVAAVLDERSTQPTIDREDLLEKGSELAIFELYTRYTPESDVAAARWILTHRVDGFPIFGPGPDTAFPSHLIFDTYSQEVPPGGYRIIPESRLPDNSYIYINEYSNKRGQYYSSAGGGIGVFNESRFRRLSELPIAGRNIIYDSGDTEIYGPE